MKVMSDAVGAEVNTSVSEVAAGQESITERSLPAEDSSTVLPPHTSTVCYRASVRLNIKNICMFCALVFTAGYIECRVKSLPGVSKKLDS